MKLRYFIPLLLVSAVLLMLIYTAFLGAATSWALPLMKDQYAGWNLVILRTVAILASGAIGLLVLPLGYAARNRGPIWGMIMAALGLMLVINPWNQDALSMLWGFMPEYVAYVLACWACWKLGAWLGNRKREPNQPAQVVGAAVVPPEG